VLTDERYAPLFSGEEQDVIAAHVPWTRIVTEERAEDIRRRRDQLVMKPNDEYGGTGVTLGWDTSERGWDEAIDKALREWEDGRLWVVQERIAIRRESFPVCTDDGVAERDMLVDFAPYVFRGRVGGFLTRLSATGLANVTSGGGQVPAFIVADRGRRA
jgi:uncharacterized circularly permuted ATP-grasp superfamily protein